jgi:hypothetical protein
LTTAADAIEAPLQERVMEMIVDVPEEQAAALDRMSKALDLSRDELVSIKQRFEVSSRHDGLPRSVLPTSPRTKRG